MTRLDKEIEEPFEAHLDRNYDFDEEPMTDEEISRLREAFLAGFKEGLYRGRKKK